MGQRALAAKCGSRVIEERGKDSGSDTDSSGSNGTPLEHTEISAFNIREVDLTWKR